MNWGTRLIALGAALAANGVALAAVHFSMTESAQAPLPRIVIVAPRHAPEQAMARRQDCPAS